MSLFANYILMQHCLGLCLHPQAPQKVSAVVPHNTTTSLAPQDDRQQTPPAQQARTPSCGGHGVSHARLPGRPLGPRRDLITAPSLHREDLERMVSAPNLLLTLALELLHFTSLNSQISPFADILQPPR